MKTKLLLLCALLFSIGAFSQTTIYVDADATGGSNNGTNWANAYTDLQSALSAASLEDEIWVAEGTYKPTTTAARTISFEIPSDVEVYGGFAGTESAVSERTDFGLGGANETILSGDIGSSGVNTDNSYHVVKFTNASSTTILDGFTITKGYAEDVNQNDTPNNCGGGIYNDGSGSDNSSNPQITNCIITYNYAYYQGGGVHNEANVGETTDTAGESSPTFTNCDITYNTTTKDGAGVNNEGEDGSVSSPTFTDCTISNNTASDDGGGIYNDASNGTSSPTFTDCTISDNTATSYGGGICNDATESSNTSVSSPIFTGCTISGNEGYYGGGVANYGDIGTSSPTFTDCTISGNDGYHGGGIYNYSDDGTANPELTDCTFENNTSDYYGGGIYNVADDGTANLGLTNCTFNNNTSEWGGGGLYNYSTWDSNDGPGEANPVINNCSFTNNSTQDYYGGGAIFNYGEYSTANLTITNTTFSGNESTYTGYYCNGGAIAQYKLDEGYGGEVNSIITNCLFFDNMADYGGAIYDEDEDAGTGTGTLSTQIINCTFNNNDSYAYSAESSGVTTTIKNCIFWGNIDGEIYESNSPTITVTYSDVEDSYTGTGNIDSDPLFADAANDDYRLTSFSPCADVGNNGANSETNDIRGAGFGRKLNKATGASGTIDMGAYEYNYGTDPSITTLTWDAGAGTSAWNTANNWNPNTIPTAQYNVIIPDLSTDPVIANGITADCYDMEVQVSASLTINSGGSLITAGTITNNGAINIEQTITDSKWHYISSPITNATSQLFAGDYLQYWTEDGLTWTDIGPTNHPLTPAQGFSLWGTPDKGNYTFTGTPNTGEQSIQLSYHANQDPEKDSEGFNLVGNPYPSSIDWGTLNTPYGAAYIWNPDAINDEGGQGDYIELTSGDIAPMQGFFIYTTNDGSNFTLQNSNRSHGGTFYKNEEKNENEILLLASNGNYADELRIITDEQANEQFELTKDAWKIISNASKISQLWSVSSDGKLAIDSRPAQETIQLGYANQTEGYHHIAIQETSENFPTIIEDTKLNKFHDLSLGAYHFNWQTTDSEERFILHLKATGLEDIEDQEVQVYVANGQVYIRLDQPEDYNQLQLIDLSGRLIAEYSLQQQSLQSFDFENLNGAYLIRLIGKKKTITKKVILR